MNQKTDIILVEDDDSDAELTIQSLKRNNLLHELIRFKNGEETLEYIFATGKYSKRNINDIPKVILLDLKIPRIGGLEVLRRIKSDARTQIIPVVVLTSSKEDEHMIEGYKWNVNSYIIKPVGFENFSNIVSSVASYWLSPKQPSAK